MRIHQPDLGRSSCFFGVRLVAVFVEELIDTLGVAPRGSSHRLETCFMRQCWKYVFGFLDIFGSFKIYTIFWPYAADFPKSKVTSSKKTTDSFHVLELPFDFWKTKNLQTKNNSIPKPFGLLPGVPQKIIANKNAPGSGSVTTVFCWGEFFSTKNSPSPWAIPWLNPPLHSWVPRDQMISLASTFPAALAKGLVRPITLEAFWNQRMVLVRFFFFPQREMGFRKNRGIPKMDGL